MILLIWTMFASFISNGHSNRISSLHSHAAQQWNVNNAPGSWQFRVQLCPHPKDPPKTTAKIKQKETRFSMSQPGRYWVKIIPSHRCNFTDDFIQRNVIRITYSPCPSLLLDFSTGGNEVNERKFTPQEEDYCEPILLARYELLQNREAEPELHLRTKVGGHNIGEKVKKIGMPKRAESFSASLDGSMRSWNCAKTLTDYLITMYHAFVNSIVLSITFSRKSNILINICGERNFQTRWDQSQSCKYVDGLFNYFQFFRYLCWNEIHRKICPVNMAKDFPGFGRNIKGELW